jgi:hypothetical protein
LTTRSCLKRAGEVGFEQRMTGSTTRWGLRPSEPRGRTDEQETGRDNMRLDPASSDAESKARSRPGELYCVDCFAVRTAVAMHTTLPHYDPTTTRNRGAQRKVGAQGTTGPTVAMARCREAEWRTALPERAGRAGASMERHLKKTVARKERAEKLLSTRPTTARESTAASHGQGPRGSCAHRRESCVVRREDVLLLQARSDEEGRRREAPVSR